MQPALTATKKAPLRKVTHSKLIHKGVTFTKREGTVIIKNTYIRRRYLVCKHYVDVSISAPERHHMRCKNCKSE